MIKVVCDYKPKPNVREVSIVFLIVFHILIMDEKVLVLPGVLVEICRFYS